MLLRLRIDGPGRDGATEVVEQVPSGLAAFDGASLDSHGCAGHPSLVPRRIEGQRVIFVVEYQAATDDELDEPTVPGTFCLAYAARVVTAGTYAWQPAVARQVTSPGLVATARAGTVELR